jgi:hypothetical protein
VEGGLQKCIHFLYHTYWFVYAFLWLPHASFQSNRNNSPALNLSVSPDKVKGKLESLFYCDTGVPEEKIEKPTGLPKGLRSIGNKPKCPRCKAKGAVHCATCSGSGLYVDSILESQGIIVKVRCLGMYFIYENPYTSLFHFAGKNSMST